MIVTIGQCHTLGIFDDLTLSLSLEKTRKTTSNFFLYFEEMNDIPLHQELLFVKNICDRISTVAMSLGHFKQTTFSCVSC